MCEEGDLEWIFEKVVMIVWRMILREKKSVEKKDKGKNNYRRLEKMMDVPLAPFEQWTKRQRNVKGELFQKVNLTVDS